MGYREQRGVVGQYRGNNVSVIAYKDLTESMTKTTDTIFAVVCNNNDKLELVQRGMYIGTMTDGGKVEIFDNGRRRAYNCHKEQKPIQKVETPEWTVKEKEVDLSQALNVEFGYGAYSKVVDNFFKGLDQLWAEIDAAIDV